MRNRLLSFILTCVIICTSFTAYAAGDAGSIADGIAAYNMKKGGVSSIQSWINGPLTSSAGTTAEWYILALSQSGSYNFSSYQSALKKYIKNNETYSATTRLKYALVLASIGSTDSYISTAINNSIGEQGIMSWVYGLHMLNNGYTCKSHTKESVKKKILSMQINGGGWAVTGSNADVDVTAMTVQALAPYYHSDSSVKSAINKAISLLSDKQRKDGDYSSFGVENAESTAQVIIALSSLGINCEKDSRFIKNGNSPIDGLEKYMLSDGSFCHKIGGGSNETATIQAYLSLVSYTRMTKGKGSIYILDHAKVKEVKPAKKTNSKKTVKKANSQTVTPAPTKEKKSSNTSVTKKKKTKKETKAKKKEKTSKKKATKSKKKKNSKKSVEKVEEEKESVTATPTPIEVKASSSYKPIACIIIILLSLLACLILFILKKRNIKNYIFVAIICAIAILILFFTNFSSTEGYYNGHVVKDNPVGTVTLAIRCDTVAGKTNSKYIPDNGIILDTTEFDIEEGDSVYDILIEAAKRYKIHLENKGSESVPYISGINYLYEFDFGELSGWMYYVNGTSPDAGSNEYKLQDGDKVEWLYTCNIGKDIK